MSERRITLQTAAFLDSAESLRLSAPDSAGIRQIVSRFLECCYQDLAAAPERLDGEQLRSLLREALPRHFGKADPLGPHCPAVLAAFLDFLEHNAVVTHIFELRQALDAEVGHCVEAIARGSAHAEGLARTSRAKTIVNRASKTGRNDPCPCGSGKKFKKCCFGLGGSKAE